MFALFFTVGCGENRLGLDGPEVNGGLTGSAYGGQQPVVGAMIQLYAAGTAGDATKSIPLLDVPAMTNSAGDFRLGPYACPSPSSSVYLTAVGGRSTRQSGGANPNLSAMVALGDCADLASTIHISIDEAFTVAAVYALAPFMKSYDSIGSDPMDTQLMTNAFRTATEMVNKT